MCATWIVLRVAEPLAYRRYCTNLKTRICKTNRADRRMTNAHSNWFTMRVYHKSCKMPPSLTLIVWPPRKNVSFFFFFFRVITTLILWSASKNVKRNLFWLVSTQFTVESRIFEPPSKTKIGLKKWSSSKKPVIKCQCLTKMEETTFGSSYRKDRKIEVQRQIRIVRRPLKSSQSYLAIWLPFRCFFVAHFALRTKSFYVLCQAKCLILLDLYVP